MSEVKPVFIIRDNPEVKNVGFGFDTYIKTISDLIAYKENETPLVIGIFGSWGTGKTTLMSNIKKELDKDKRHETEADVYRKCKTVWFQPWKYDKEEEILAALIEEIFKSMKADNFFKACEDKIAEWKKKFDGSKFIGFLTKLGTGIDISEFFHELEYKDRLGFYDTFQEFFDDLLRHYIGWISPDDCKATGKGKDEKKGVLVIFIDDLDRCPRERIRKVLETIKLFMDKEGCVFVIGAAHEVIVKELRQVYQEDAEKFMDKIVQVTFNLPQVRLEDFKSFLGKIEQRISETLSRYLYLILPAVQHNPRRLKRFINNLNLQDGLLKNKGISIEFDHLLYWNLIEFNYPSLWRNIVENKNVRFFKTLREKILLVKEKLAAESVSDRGKVKKESTFLMDRQSWQAKIKGGFLEELKIPESLHPFIEDPDLVEIIEAFACEEDQLLQIITMSEIMESIEEIRERDKISYKKDFSSMVKVPEGIFIYGDEGKRRDIEKSFEIGIYPVTNGRYEEFIKGKGYENEEYWSAEGNAWRKAKKIEKPGYWEDENFNHPEQPVVGVSFYEAEAFAKWLSKKEGKKYRLPTEWEWEKAARGTDGRKYPWGNEFDKEKCNSEESGIGKTTRVTVYPDGVSPYGCYDMSGNVWEWCDSSVGDGRVFRGGSWGNSADFCRAACRAYRGPAYRWDGGGFRLLRDL